MENRKQFNVPMTTDEHGLVGGECPSCGMYFKLKFGTGLKTTQTVCPYCGFKGEEANFFTSDQRDYIHSFVQKEVFEPMIRDFLNDLKRSETRNNDSFIQIKVSATIPEFQIHRYQEKDLETNVTCDNCGLVFSIYGVFSNCPDCGKLNARVIFDKSLDASNKKLVLSKDHTLDEHLRADFMKDALIGTVSAFDALGKALRKKHPTIPKNPNNLFQNFLKLDTVLAGLMGRNISQFLTVADSDFLFLMFQVRHIYEHNAGVIDDDFVKNLPAYAGEFGRKFPLKREDVNSFIVLMRQLGSAIYSEFEK